MTTYPLSEPATIYRGATLGDGPSQATETVAQGSLSDCAEILEGWSKEDRASVQIDVDAMRLRYGPEEIEELLDFLRHEGDG